MFLFSKHGFFSATQHANRPGVIHLRARFKGDLENLFKASRENVKQLLNQEIVATIHKANAKDLGYYCDLPKDVWTAICASEADSIDYPYFNNIVKKGSGRERAYAQVYETMLDAEE